MIPSAMPTDQTIEIGEFKAYLDPDTAQWMNGATIDYVTDATGSGFDIDNPSAKIEWDSPLAKKVQEVLDKSVTPTLVGHGGWCELVDVKENAAHVRLGGGCQGCSGARATLKDGVESMIKREVPEIEHVVDETDHGSGDTPYM